MFVSLGVCLGLAKMRAASYIEIYESMDSPLYCELIKALSSLIFDEIDFPSSMEYTVD